MALKLGELEVVIGADTSGLRKAEGEVSRVGSGMEKVFKRVGVTIAAAISFEAARRVLLVADNMAVLERRLVRFTGSSDNARKSMARLVKTASDAGAEIKTTVSLFERFSLVRDDLGATNDQILQLTDTVSKLGAIGGSSQAEVGNSLRQLSQAFAGGVVRAEEFNSIIENTPEIVKAVGREMGLSMGEMRARMLEGELTAKDVFDAMLRASEDTNREFEKLPKSIERVTQSLVNELSVAIGNADEGLGFSAAISTAIDDLAKLIGKLNDTSTAVEDMRNRIGPDDKPADLGFIMGAVGKVPGLRLIPQAIQSAIGPTKAERTPEQQQARDMNDLLNERIRLQKMVNDLAGMQARGMQGSSLEFDGPFGLPSVRSLADRRAELQAVNEQIRELRSSSSSAAALQDVRGGLGEPSGAPGLGNPNGVNPLLDPGAVGSLSPAKRDATEEEQDAITRIQRLNETEKEEIARLAEERRAFVRGLDMLEADERKALLDEIQQRRTDDLQDLKDRELEIERRAAEAREKLAKEETDKILKQKREEADALVNMMNQTSSAISNVLQLTGDSSAAKAANIISQVASLATTIVSISAAQAQAQAAADPTAITLPQKIANIAILTSQFVGIFAALKSAKGGGRQFGGSVSPMLAHPVNEAGPEVLTQAGRQYLLPNGKGGNVTPLKSGGGSGGGAANVTIISNGTPQTITGTQVSRDEVRVMIDDASKGTEKRINSSLASGRGDTARSLQSGFRLERNLS